MPKYVLDSNIYIAATRSEAASAELEAFLWSSTPFIYLHSVVAAELLAGAANVGLERRTHAAFIEPLEDARRVITPSHAAWTRAGRIIARLVRAGRLSAGGIPKSLLNDCLIATAARDHGCTIITRNVSDFELIGTVHPVSAVPPWPAD